MAEEASKGTVPAIRMRVPANLYAYLEILAHDTMLGDTVNEVAEFVLKRRLEVVRVYSHSGDYDDAHDELLRPIAEEVKRQLEASDGRGPAAIFFEEWKRS